MPQEPATATPGKPEPMPSVTARGSRLGRLFLYSKDSKVSAQENFTTEALAQAIADDHRPMLAGLRALSLVTSASLDLSGGVTLRPSTQVYLEGGFLDLVLEVIDETGAARGAVWVEVKIGAPESGDQLDGYRRAASARPRPTWVVTLAGAAVRQDVPNLSWMDLYQRARRTPGEHRSWRDLRMFLEEQMVASDALGPMTDREAGSIEAAYELMQKASEVIAVVHRGFPGLFGPTLSKRLSWSSEAALLNAAAQNFRKTGEFAGFGGGIFYGIMAEEGTAYWYVGVTVDRASKVGAEGVRAAAGTLDPSIWDRPASGNSVLVARARATALGGHAQVAAWFDQRLRELAGSHAVELAIGIEPAGLSGAE